jgi:hypothetical protein
MTLITRRAKFHLLHKTDFRAVWYKRKELQTMQQNYKLCRRVSNVLSSKHVGYSCPMSQCAVQYSLTPSIVITYVHKRLSTSRSDSCPLFMLSQCYGKSYGKVTVAPGGNTALFRKEMKPHTLRSSQTWQLLQFQHGNSSKKLFGHESLNTYFVLCQISINLNGYLVRVFLFSKQHSI